MADGSYSAALIIRWIRFEKEFGIELLKQLKQGRQGHREGAAWPEHERVEIAEGCKQ